MTTTRQSGTFAVNVLGSFELHRENQAVAATPAAQRLLAYVATRTKTITRVAAARSLWPDHSDARAAANLRSTLWRLRHEHQGGPIRSTPQGIELDPHTTIDIHAIHARIAVLTSVPDSPPDLDPGLLRHDVLPDWTDDWLLMTREWFRQLRLHALEALCVRHSRYGRYDAALEAGMAALDCEPLRESAHRAVVRVHLAEGNPAEALRQYDLYRRLLYGELGLRPSQQFRALVSHLLGRPLDGPPP